MVLPSLYPELKIHCWFVFQCGIQRNQYELTAESYGRNYTRCRKELFSVYLGEFLIRGIICRNLTQELRRDTCFSLCYTSVIPYQFDILSSEFSNSDDFCEMKFLLQFDGDASRNYVSDLFWRETCVTMIRALILMSLEEFHTGIRRDFHVPLHKPPTRTNIKITANFNRSFEGRTKKQHKMVRKSKSDISKPARILMQKKVLTMSEQTRQAWKIQQTDDRETQNKRNILNNTTQKYER